MIRKITLIALAFAAIGFSSCQQKQTADLSIKENGFNIDTLNLQTALRYVKNYRKHAGKIGPDKGSNTRSIWFSRERLRAIVDTIYKEGGDGVRFYLAAYDTVYTADFKGGHKPDSIYWGYNTLVMVSTKKDVSKGYIIHQDYYDKKPANGQNGGLQGLIIGTTPENRGEQCPPPATCTGASLLLLGN
jgi:hypothetical protein